MGEVVALKRQSRCFLRQELEADGKWVGTYQLTLLLTKSWLHLTENVFTPLAMAIVLTERTSLSFHALVTLALHPTATGLKSQPSLNMDGSLGFGLDENGDWIELSNVEPLDGIGSHV